MREGVGVFGICWGICVFVWFKNWLVIAMAGHALAGHAVAGHYSFRCLVLGSFALVLQ